MGEYPYHNTTGQRQHTNPKSQLKRWAAAEVSGYIWCYRKEREPGLRVYRQTLASATVLRGIWSEEAEQRVNTEVEQAAVPGLRELAESPAPQLVPDQRQAVARYLMSMYRRGWQELATQPARLGPEVERMGLLIEEAGFDPLTAEALREALADLGEHPPGRPLPIKEVSEVIAAMRWIVLEDADGQFFNGDSPVQIVPSATVVSRDCELTMPLAPTRALVCDWGAPKPWTILRAATPADVEAVNRRTARGAERQVYLPRRLSEEFVLGVVESSGGSRIHAAAGTRKVPWKHRVTMRVAARRILNGLEGERLALVEELKEDAVRHGLWVRNGQ